MSTVIGGQMFFAQTFFRQDSVLKEIIIYNGNLSSRKSKLQQQQKMCDLGKTAFFSDTIWKGFQEYF